MIKNNDVNKAWADFNDGKISYDHWMAIWEGSQAANFASTPTDHIAEMINVTPAGFNLGSLGDVISGITDIGKSSGIVSSITDMIGGKKNDSSLLKTIILLVLAGKFLADNNNPLIAGGMAALTNFLGLKKDGSDVLTNITKLASPESEDKKDAPPLAVEASATNDSNNTINVLKDLVQQIVKDKKEANAEQGLKDMILNLTNSAKSPEVVHAGYNQTVENVPKDIATVEKTLAEYLKKNQEMNLQIMNSNAEVFKAGFSQLSDTMTKSINDSMKKVSDELDANLKKMVSEFKKSLPEMKAPKNGKEPAKEPEISVDQATAFMEDLGRDLNAITPLAKNRTQFINTANRLDRVFRQLDHADYTANSFTLKPEEWYGMKHYVVRGKKSDGSEVMIHFKPMKDKDGNNVTMYDAGEEMDLSKHVEEIKNFKKKTFAA